MISVYKVGNEYLNWVCSLCLVGNIFCMVSRIFVRLKFQTAKSILNQNFWNLWKYYANKTFCSFSEGPFVHSCQKWWKNSAAWKIFDQIFTIFELYVNVLFEGLTRLAGNEFEFIQELALIGKFCVGLSIKTFSCFKHPNACSRWIFEKTSSLVILRFRVLACLLSMDTDQMWFYGLIRQLSRESKTNFKISLSFLVKMKIFRVWTIGIANILRSMEENLY